MSDAILAGFRTLSLQIRAAASAVKTNLGKPPTQENVLYHYLPLCGAANYQALALAVINPKLVRNFNAACLGIVRWDLLNAYLAASVVGLSLHLYSRRLMGGQRLQRRAAFSLYFGGVFVLGSVLAWSVLARSLLPWNPLVRTVAAVAVSSGMLVANRTFLDALEAKVH
jgi:hypothetical protein